MTPSFSERLLSVVTRLADLRAEGAAGEGLRAGDFTPLKVLGEAARGLRQEFEARIHQVIERVDSLPLSALREQVPRIFADLGPERDVILLHFIDHLDGYVREAAELELERNPHILPRLTEALCAVVDRGYSSKGQEALGLLRISPQEGALPALIRLLQQERSTYCSVDYVAEANEMRALGVSKKVALQTIASLGSKGAPALPAIAPLIGHWEGETATAAIAAVMAIGSSCPEVDKALAKAAVESKEVNVRELRRRAHAQLRGVPS